MRNSVQTLFGSPVKRTRMLALLLLAAIAWGSTVEFTHHHGAKTKADESLSSTTQSTIADEALATQFSSSNTNGTSSKSKRGAECLICQLHQNLSATEISQTLGVGPIEIRRLNAPPSAL